MKLVTYGFILVGSVLALFLVTTFVSSWFFNKKVEAEVGDLFAAKTDLGHEVVREQDLQGLPPAVQKWLRSSGVVGKVRPNTVRLRQIGEMRTTPDQAWMPFSADYYYTVYEPGFIWHADVKAAPLIHLKGRDRLYLGHGHMLIKLGSLINVADGKGAEIDQGSLVRYLAETAWFPAAALENYIRWESSGPNSAQATITVGKLQAIGTFFFDDKGRLVKFLAPRYMERDGSYFLQTWKVILGDHKVMNGTLVPAYAEVIWDLPEGEFVWLRGKLLEMEYDRPEFYSSRR